MIRLATGLSVFLFMLTLWVLLRNRKERRVNWAMVSASSALLLLSTMVRSPVQGFASAERSSDGDVLT